MTVINAINILADASSRGLALPQIPAQADMLTWCQQMMPGTAMVLIIMGVIYLLFGFKIIKGLVMINAVVVGAGIGAALGKHGETALACAIIGAFIAAAIAWPAMKYAVALMGGILGGFVGGSIWIAAGLQPDLAWAGGLVGLVGFGLLSFILFRGSVMMYTSLQGALMLVAGVLGLCYKYPDMVPKLNSHLRVEPFLLPAAVVIPAIIGLIFQQHHTAHGGGGGGGKK
jgi:hypothetical protein